MRNKLQERHHEQRIDQALVVRARLGQDPQAFEQLVRRHQGWCVPCCAV